MKVLIKKYIKSEVDLPKEDGKFWVKYKSTADVCLLENFIVGEENDKYLWLNDIEYWLCEFELSDLINVPSDKEIINRVSLNTVVYHNDREVYGTHFGVGEDNREVYDECVKIGKWVRDEIIRRNVSNYKDETK